MKNNLPPAFVESIDSLLQDDAAQFWQALSLSSLPIGLRINPEKTDGTKLLKELAADFTTIPWEENGYRYQGDEVLGKHPYHGAGLYYLQEPSAMAPVSILDPQPGERVLDLCAAPGGKTTQIHSRMSGKGIIIANDPNPHRVQALALNVERWGAKNISVLCETPQKLVNHFGDYFDRVLVDAPCSGEGTFRTHPGEIKKWSLKFSQRSANIQDEILWFAAKLVRPGGFLVYSTCTFNQLENEGTIIRFLEKEPGFSLDLIPKLEGFSTGIPISETDLVDLTKTVRIWPHLSEGEGHFIARMQKTGNYSLSNPLTRTAFTTFNAEQAAIYQTFFDNNLLMTSRTIEIAPDSRELGLFGNRLYRILSGSPDLEGLNIRHWGWWLGTFQSGHFIPSPALAAGLKQEDVQKVLEFSIGEPDLASYQRGSPISIPEKGFLPGSWVLVTIASNPLGWGKVQKGRLKSHYPTWLRIN